MTKITCYAGQIEAMMNYLYNPNSKKAIRYDNDEIAFTEEVLHPALANVYKRMGNPIEIEESSFNEVYNKLLQAENIKKETKGLIKRLLPSSK